MARNRPPSFDFYPDDFLAGTMHLHPVCIGIYIRLLCFQWSHGAIPNNRRELLQVTGTLPEELDEHLSQVLLKFEKCEDGQMRNARMERERARKMQVSESRANAASARWSSRPNAESELRVDANASANASAKSNAKVMPPIRKMEVGSRKMEDGRKEDGAQDNSWIVPEALDTPRVRQLLDEFVAMRKRIRKPIRDLATSSKVLSHFDDEEHLCYALDLCIANDWQGLKADYRPAKAKGPKTFTQQRVSNTQAAMEEFINAGK